MGYRNMESSREYAAESTEVPATWFGILNSLLLVLPGFSKWWESNIYPANEIWTRTYC
jgi:hypothetical protein